MQGIATRLDAKEISVTRTWTQCQVFDYQLQPKSPPSFHLGFRTALVTLASACAKTFINQFGTHQTLNVLFSYFDIFIGYYNKHLKLSVVLKLQ